MSPLHNSIRKVADADGGVVLDLRRGAMFRVNLLGTRVLDLLEQGDSPGQIARTLSAEFSLAESDVQSDVAEFLESLTRHGVFDPR